MSKTKGTEDKLEKKCYCANTKKTVGNYNLKLSTKKVVENAIRICMQYKFFNVLYNEMEKMEGVPQQQRLNTTPPNMPYINYCKHCTKYMKQNNFFHSRSLNKSVMSEKNE